MASSGAVLHDVGELRRAVCAAEARLLYTPFTDPTVGVLRDEACALVVDLLGTLGKLERRLAGTSPDRRETHAG